jgi:hypothetical protein
MKNSWFVAAATGIIENIDLFRLILFYFFLDSI